MTPDDLARLNTRMRELLPADAAGRITYAARANAVKGRVPAGTSRLASSSRK